MAERKLEISELGKRMAPLAGSEAPMAWYEPVDGVRPNHLGSLRIAPALEPEIRAILDMDA